MADSFHFDTDPNPGSENIRYGSGSRQKRTQYQENFKEFDFFIRSYAMFCEFILLNYHFSVNKHLNWVKKVNLFSVFNVICWIQIRMI